MIKIISYGVSSSEGDINKLAEDVNKRLEEGYQPLGGISSTICGNVVCYAQAMVKYEDLDSN